MTAQSGNCHLLTCLSFGEAILLPQRTQIGDPWNVFLKHTRDFVVVVVLDSSISSTKNADVSHEVLHLFLSTGLFGDLGLHSYGPKGCHGGGIHFPSLSPLPASACSSQPQDRGSGCKHLCSLSTATH